MTPRLAIITTHPIQYNAPWFRLLAERGNLAVKVFYTWSQVETEEKFDPGFGKAVAWDIPLLEGYDHTFVKNTSRRPGSKSFQGIQNPTLIEEVESWQADVVLVFGWKFESHLAAMKHFKGRIPVLFRGDSHLLDEQPFWRSMLRKVVLRRIFKKIDYALYVGAANKEYYRAAALKNHQLIYVPHAVDNDRFAGEEAPEVPAWPSLHDGKKVFLFAGKLESQKNPELLVKLFHDKIKEAHLVMVGNGPMEHHLKSAYGSVPNIHFVDFQNQRLMPSVYKKADVFVLPSAGETWGLAVNEAMAAGKPVLVSDQCGCALDLVEEGITGYTFASGNAGDLLKKIQLMLSHETNLSQMGGQAAEKIKRWSFDAIVESIENLLIRTKP